MTIKTPQRNIVFTAQVLFLQVTWIETIILRQNVGCKTQMGKFKMVHLFNEVFEPVDI